MEYFHLFIEYLNTNKIFAYSIIILYGLFIGSFLNVVIYRLPIMMNNEYIGIIKDVTELPDDILTSKMSKEEKEEFINCVKNKDMNLSFPSSTCGSCNQKIPIWHNIPIISYILLKGKCSKCKQSYSPRYLIVEAFVGIFFGFSYYMLGTTIEFLMITALFTGLIASAFIDLKHRILPDSITFGGLFLGLYYNTISSNNFISPQSSIEGAILGFLAVYIFVKGYEKLRDLDMAMGDGDLKLYALCGAWVGLYDLVFLIVLSTIIGLIQFLILLPFKKKLSEYQLPFGPAIIISLFLFLYFGNPFLNLGLI